MIGIYDSGIGGLGIFRSIRAVLPDESIWYFGDTKYFPFGNRPADEIRAVTLAGLQHLATQCSVIVIACNTASVNDLAYYRAQVNVPIIGVVPVIKTASQLTKNNTIALLATTATVQAGYTQELIKTFAPDKTVQLIGCPGLASEIEHGTLTRDKLATFLQPIKAADVVVLGCTHYTLIKGLIQNQVGPDVRVIDSNEAVARQVLRVLRNNNLEQPQTQAHYRFECSGDDHVFQQQAKKYI